MRLSAQLRAASVSPESFDLAGLAEDAARLEAAYEDLFAGSVSWACRDHRAQDAHRVRCVMCERGPSEPRGRVEPQDDGRTP